MWMTVFYASWLDCVFCYIAHMDASVPFTLLLTRTVNCPRGGGGGGVKVKVNETNARCGIGN